MKIIAADAMSPRDGQRLSETDSFSFECQAGLSCFNQCCRNLNLFLYPYDVLRLKNSLGISAAGFIDRHVDIVMRDGNYFPDVLLSMTETAEKTCPFLTKAGCSVYPDRAYSCRLFPVEQGLHYDDSGPAGRMVYFFRPPDFCRGQHQARSLTVKGWIDDQQADTYIQMTRRWAEIKAVFAVNPWGAEGAYGAKAKMAFMASYNMDSFRNFLFNSSFLKRYRVRDDILKNIRESETELLLFGFEWIKHYVWGAASPWVRPG
jgi:Fe-S-cluster containining protein